MAGGTWPLSVRWWLRVERLAQTSSGSSALQSVGLCFHQCHPNLDPLIPPYTHQVDPRGTGYITQEQFLELISSFYAM